MISRLVLLGAGAAILVSLTPVRDALRAETLSAADVSARVPARMLPIVALSGHAVAADTVPMYTAEQLAAGTALYEKVCKDCHEDADYTTDTFRQKWNGKTLNDLYEEIRTKMPDDNPNSLTRDQYAEAMAYVLKLNGVPAGPNRVAPDSTAMKAIILNFAAPPSVTP